MNATRNAPASGPASSLLLMPSGRTTASANSGACVGASARSISTRFPDAAFTVDRPAILVGAQFADMTGLLELRQIASDRPHQLQPVRLGRILDHQLQCLHHLDRARLQICSSSAKCKSNEGDTGKARELMHEAAIAAFRADVAGGRRRPPWASFQTCRTMVPITLTRRRAAVRADRPSMSAGG